MNKDTARAIALQDKEATVVTRGRRRWTAWLPLVVLALVLMAAGARADTCPEYSPELDRVLWMAYAIADPHNLGHTLAAITIREAGGVEPYVIRVNPDDGAHGSYGVAHMQLTTAMELEGETNVWKAKAEIAPRLMTDDAYALRLALRYLLQHSGRGWWAQVARYRGAGPLAAEYADYITDLANRLETCGYFKV